MAAALVTGQASAACSPSGSQKLARMFYSPDGRFVTVVAHRGLWGQYRSNTNSVPENSTASINAAMAACLDAMEVDVKMTSDGVPVLMHDFNLGRTTNAWMTKPGATKYSPENNTGYNPTVASLPANVVTSMKLQVPARTNLSGSYVPSVTTALLTLDGGGNVSPMIFDIKTVEAVRAVNTAAKRVYDRPGDVTAIKVNASLYQSRRAFQADSPYIKGIPIFVTNNLGKINITQVFNDWVEDTRSALEINVKSTNGILQGELNRAKTSHLPSGVFHALPDYPGGGGRFYDNDGHCCYTLADKYFTPPNGTRETQDLRGDLNYINGQGFTFVTTDDSIRVTAFMKSKGRR